jgi:hypothetical protein
MVDAELLWLENQLLREAIAARHEREAVCEDLNSQDDEIAELGFDLDEDEALLKAEALKPWLRHDEPGWVNVPIERDFNTRTAGMARRRSPASRRRFRSAKRHDRGRSRTNAQAQSPHGHRIRARRDHPL